MSETFIKIVFDLKVLGAEVYTLLFQLMEASIQKRAVDSNILGHLKAFGGVYISRNPIKGDIYRAYGLEEFDSAVIDGGASCCFTILINAMAVGNPSNMVPLLLLQKHFDGIVAIGIDLEECDIKEQPNIIFKFSNFLLFVDDRVPLCGYHSVYFTNEKAENRSKDATQREKSSSCYYVSNNRVTALRYKSTQTNKSIEGAIAQASRYFQPLMYVDKSLYGRLFQNAPSGESLEESYIKHSIEKLKSRLGKLKKPAPGYSSLFEEWFFLAFYWSLPDSELKKLNVDALNLTLHDYYIGVYELVQNIIFHTEEQFGWLYVMFCKEEDLSQDDYTHFWKKPVETGNTRRYLKIGVYDFSKQGISDTFCKNNSITDIDLSQLINPHVIPIVGSDETGMEAISLTYAAHLGIKTLVSSIMYHEGCFRIESSHLGEKEVISGSTESIDDSRKVKGVEGTHYDILLPVKEFERGSVYPLQSSSINDFINTQIGKSDWVDAINISECVDSEFQSGISTPSGQRDWIERVAINIMQKQTTKESDAFSGLCALNMDSSAFLNPNHVLKLLAYVQLRMQALKALVLVNLTDNVIAYLCRIVEQTSWIKNEKKQPIWSRDHAVVMYGNSFGAHILCGETVQELEYVNQCMCQIYPGCSNSLIHLNALQKDNADGLKSMNSWAIPYECVVRVNGTPLFLNQVNVELDKHIGGSSGGYLVDEFFSKLGSKLYMERFYEADTIFQNGFFVDRFAFFIARDIVNRRQNSQKLQGKPIVIIGYLSYSEPISRRIQYYVNQTNPGAVSKVVTAVEMEGSNDMAFHWQNMQKETLGHFDDRFYYATIVPISSTMSSHDKTISIFKKNAGDSTLEFPYQYSVFLIRDRVGQDDATDIEKEWGISSVFNGIVKANYKESKQVQFLVSKESIWHNLVDKYSFPEHFQEEIFLNRTENASLNTRDFFGFPMAALPSIEDMKDELYSLFPESKFENISEEYYKLTCSRLIEFRDSIQIGHIEHHGNHHRYFFNTESYVGKDGNPEFIKWLEYQKKRINSKFPDNLPCVIITPDVNKESCFVDRINESVFAGTALIVHLDVYSSAQNISFKYAFLRQLPNNSKFFFVDHAILTSGTFERARLLLAFVKRNKPHVFDGIITVVNRLTYSLFGQIQKEVGDYGVVSYLWFSILPSKNTYTKCSLCGLELHYRHLRNCSVVHDGRTLCEHNSKKFSLSNIEYYVATQTANVPWVQDKEMEKRRLDRMMAQYRLFYHISLLAVEEYVNLGLEYNGTRPSGKTISNSVIEYLGKEYGFVSNDINKKISFLKAVTFPPLSQYVYIRQFAFNKNLEELSELIDKSNPNYTDFCMMRVLLKHLSYLSSNALVRKKVIVGSWKLCQRVLHETEKSILLLQADSNSRESDRTMVALKDVCREPDLFSVTPKVKLDELSQLKQELEDFGANMLFYIKNAIHNDESKSFYLGELLRTGNELDVTKPLEMHPTKDCVFATDLREDEKFLSFVDWLYYDNSAIMRKTLYNFEKELEKQMTGLKQLFNNSSDTLFPLEEFENNVNSIVETLLDVVKDNYYYAWFRLFVTEDSLSKGQLIDSNKDGVPLVKKLIYVLYAKKLFENIKNGKGKGFINDVETLLKVAAIIMDAKECFVSIKYNGHFNTLAKNTNKNDELTLKSYDILAEVVSKDLNKIPFLIKEDESFFSEIHSAKFKRGCFMPLFDNENKIRKPIGVVSFLYENDSIKFKTRKRECARLMLLLCEEIGKYITHCKDEKYIDIWETKRIYRKTNFTSNHRLHLGSWDFESLDTDSFVKIHKGLYMLSNVVVGHLFSVISEEKVVDFISQPVSISKIFSEKFLALLNELSSERWHNTLKPITLGEVDFTIDCNVVIMQSLIIQCLENAYGKYADSSKSITIEFGVKSFSIRNTIVNVEGQRLEEDKTLFESKYNKRLKSNIQHSRLSDYGMTLVSLYVYCKSIGLNCKWFFNTQPMAYFKLEISKQ